MIRSVFVLTFLTLMWGTIQPQQEPPQQPLNFVLSADKTTHSAYEPLVLTMTISNTGQQLVQGDFDSFNFGWKDLKLYYRKKGTEFKEYYSLAIWIAQGLDGGPGKNYKRQTIKSGDQRSTNGMLLYDTAMGLGRKPQFVLNGPGEYEFKATYYYILEDPSKILESNVLTITVVKPPAEEIQPLASWKDKDLALAVQGDEVSEKGTRKLRLFLENYPYSIYTTALRSSAELLTDILAKRIEEESATQNEKSLYELLRLKN